MAKRYDQLRTLIDERKPQSIIEVGVHRGDRARLMLKQARLYHRRLRYIGFDVFETKGEQFQRDALNGKGMVTDAAARRAIGGLRDVTFELVIGDTRDTLHGQPRRADFAFIDGDHRIEVIRGDYEALKNIPLVVFDDYFRIAPDGSLPDLSRFGANAVVDALPSDMVEILPVTDNCGAGGVAHLAVVRNRHAR